MNIVHYRPDLLVINVPDWFRDPEFLAFLDRPGTMTWHPKGEQPGEYSDVMLMVDPGLSGEGAEQCVLPDRYWDKVVDVCRERLVPGTDHHVLVKLTNLQE